MSALYYEAERPRRLMADYDQSLVWAVLLLMAIGIVMVYSASIAIAEAGRFTGNRAHFYLVRQSMFVGIGLVAAAVERA